MTQGRFLGRMGHPPPDSAPDPGHLGLRYVPDHRLPAELRPRAIACDGLTEAGLHLSHWPGNATPARYKADLSTEMALLFAESPMPSFEVATNNHHDADGVLSLFALLQPDLARAHREALVRAAAIGDFAHGDDEEALKLAAALAGLLEHPQSPLRPALEGLDDADAGALATERALAMMPALLRDGPASLEPLWADELGWFQASRDAVRDGSVRVTELPRARLSVLEWDAEVHPAVADGAARGDLLLHVIEGGEGFHYRADWRGYCWAETVSPERPPIARVPLDKLLLPLNSLETNRRGRWMSAGYQGQGMTEAMRFTTLLGEEMESALQPTEVVQKLAWFVMERGPPGR